MQSESCNPVSVSAGLLEFLQRARRCFGGEARRRFGQFSGNRAVSHVT